MDYRSGQQWLRLQARANELADVLGFQGRRFSQPWNPLSTTGAGRILHALMVFAWMAMIVASALAGRPGSVA